MGNPKQGMAREDRTLLVLLTLHLGFYLPAFFEHSSNSPPPQQCPPTRSQSSAKAWDPTSTPSPRNTSNMTSSNPTATPSSPPPAPLLALRLRRSRAALFRAFKSVEKPHSIRFADGREEVLPDMTSLVRPSKVGDVATFALLGMGGLFLGGEVGLLTGSFRARQGIGRDREGRDRIAGAFKKFRADALRKQAEDLERDADAGKGQWI
ncbi:unnamed protein product [Zymoseptoria tritici ST99CH_3D7]|uniref:Uncharacterized protein n=1 Tax=Zymoseptoria tritici (strain ST99CH_3D7) TaxID=1276538 RepID=A0A1X7RQT3_ZYMT9|nr:unnamed protein product [Zymoseptoria tritici ST99CH_3D7]